MTADGEAHRAAAEASSETAPLLPGPNAPNGVFAGAHGPAAPAGAGNPAPEEPKGNTYMAKLLPALAIGVRRDGTERIRGPGERG